MPKPLKLFIIISIVILSLGILSLYFFYDPISHKYFPKCFFNQATGLHCPGCGTQRAVHSFLQGDIIKGISYNILFSVFLIIMVYRVLLYTLKKFTTKKYYNILHNPIVTYAIVIFIILFWILRNINIYPFTLLAP